MGECSPTFINFLRAVFCSFWYNYTELTSTCLKVVSWVRKLIGFFCIFGGLGFLLYVMSQTLVDYYFSNVDTPQYSYMIMSLGALLAISSMIFSIYFCYDITNTDDDDEERRLLMNESTYDPPNFDDFCRTSTRISPRNMFRPQLSPIEEMSNESARSSITLSDDVFLPEDELEQL